MEKSQHLDPVWLRAKYIDEGLSTYEIGRLVGRDPKRVHQKLQDFGIPTRPRGQNLSQQDNYMKQAGAVNPFQGKQHSVATKQLLSEKASVPKPWLRGAANGMYGKNGSQNPNYIDGSSPERQRLYANAEFKTVLAAVYRRDGFKCVRCATPKQGPKSLHAHHLQSWAGNESLRLDPNNMVSLCRKCHEWVHSRQNTGREYLIQ